MELPDHSSETGSERDELMKALDQVRVPRLSTVIAFLILQLLGLLWLFLCSKALGG